jgi:GR25 family glycosyltransferase involved in LPS biosynthesis
MNNLIVAVINLDKDKVRMERSKRQLDDLKLPFLRVQAIEGKALNLESCLVSNANVAACWLSHVKCYETLLSSKFERMLILEDDFVIKHKKSFLLRLNAASNSEHNLIQLGFLSFGVVPKFEQLLLLLNKIFLILTYAIPVNSIDVTLFKKIRNRRERFQSAGKGFIPSDFLAGAHGYVVDRKAAELLRVVNHPVFLPADGLLQSVSRSGTLSAKRSIQSYITQAPGISSIESRFMKRR